MADPMFEANDDKLLKEMYGEDAARFSGKDSMFREAHSSATGACSETFDEETGGPAPKKAPPRQHGPRGAAAARGAVYGQKYIGTRPPAARRGRGEEPGAVRRGRRLLMGTLAATVCLMLVGTALTSNSGSQLSVLRRAYPQAFVQKIEDWNGRGQTARAWELLRGNDMGYFSYATSGELGLWSAQTDYARRYEDVFIRWGTTCWDYVQGKTDSLPTDLSLLGYAVADVMAPAEDVPLPEDLTRRCQLGVALFLQDVGGVPRAVIEELASESYAVYSEAKREVERLLEEALPGTARAYLEQLGYDAQQPEGGDGAWN